MRAMRPRKLRPWVCVFVIWVDRCRRVVPLISIIFVFGKNKEITLYLANKSIRIATAHLRIFFCFTSSPVSDHYTGNLRREPGAVTGKAPQVPCQRMQRRDQQVCLQATKGEATTDHVWRGTSRTAFAQRPGCGRGSACQQRAHAGTRTHRLHPHYRCVRRKRESG